MPNILTGIITPSAPTNTLVGAASGQIIAANTNRVGLIVVNISTSTIYIGLNNTAILNAGIALNPNGGTWVMDEYNFCTDAVNGIAHSANNIVCIQEFTR